MSSISPGHRKLLGEVASRISGRLRASFVDLPSDDDTRVGIELDEGGRKVVIELPLALVLDAAANASGRELLRTRIKARRDRMMFKVPPPALPKTIAPLMTVGASRSGPRGWRR